MNLFTQTTVQMMCTKTTPVKISTYRKPYLMKILLTLAVLLPGFCLCAADTITGPNNPLQFTASDYLEIQQKAKTEGKLYFLHFTADHVEQCIWMEKHTFSNERLAAYISNNYLAAEVDIEQPEGARLQHQYEINQLPTTLIFSTKGELIGGLTGKQTANEMLATLRNYDTPEYRILPAKAKGGNAWPAAYKAVDRKIFRPRLVPDIASGSAADYSRQQSGLTQNQVQAVRPAYTEHYPSIYTRPQNHIAARPESSFALQVGVFSNYQNAYREKSNLERYGAQGHVFPVKGSNNRTVYRLCAVNFKTRTEAEQYQKTVAPRYPDSFVKEIEK
jgi:thioredoxin-related protein